MNPRIQLVGCEGEETGRCCLLGVIYIPGVWGPKENRKNGPEMMETNKIL